MKRKISSSLYNKHYENKDKGNITKKGAINWKKATGDDRKIEFFNPKEDSHYKINIIPFEIKSENHPLVKAKETKIGELDYMIDLFVHSYVGPTNDDIVCPKENYGKACPICEKKKELYEQGDKKAAGKLNPRRRVFINVQEIVQGEPQPLTVFEASQPYFMKKLQAEAKECGNGKDIIPFADIENGKIIRFRTEGATYYDEESNRKNKYLQFESFQFLDRDEELSEDLINKAVSFDQGIVLLSYEEIEKIFYGFDGDDEKKEEKPQKSEPEKPKEEKSVEDTEKKESKTSSDTKCPHGLPWGEADKHKECKKCPSKTWGDCVDKK